MARKAQEYNYTFAYALNGKEITKEEAIQHVIDMQKKKDKEAKQKLSD